MYASVVWGVLVCAITELLSLFNSITYVWVLAVWGLVTLVAVASCFVVLHKVKPTVRSKFPQLAYPEWLLLLWIGFIVATTGVTALVAPPNTWDSMTYHMARVVHWIQNHNVAFYPTHIDRQLYANPWSEFAIMHLQIMWHGDRFANMVQWFGMVGSAIGVSLIAKRLGADRRGQIFASFVASTIPMGILQASSTKNDYTLSFWLVCFVYYVTSWVQEDKRNYANVFGAGGSLGLAVLTHGSAYIFALPFVLWLIVSQARTWRRECWKPLLVVAAVCLSVNLGHYVRNFSLFGFPLGPAPGSQTGLGAYSNDVLSLASVTSNVVRNVSLHVGTPFDWFNDKLESGVKRLHRGIGIDINDRRTTWLQEQFHIIRPANRDNVAGNPLHIALIVLSTVILIWEAKLWKSSSLVISLLALCGGFLLFCLGLKWQPWHSRLHLPLFVLWAPLISTVLVSTVNRKIMMAVTVLLMLSAIPPMFWNESRPLVGERSIMKIDREEQYFSEMLQWKEPYVEAARFLMSRKCRGIGLELGADDWEYPLWVALGATQKRPVRIEHVNVTNWSAAKSDRYPFRTVRPCGIVSRGRVHGPQMEFKDELYTRRWSRDPISVFLREPLGR